MQTCDHKVLEKITLVTSVGDFMTFFAVLAFLHQDTGSVVFASSAIFFKVVGRLLSHALFPWLMNFWSPREIIVRTQFTSAALVLLLFFGMTRQDFFPSYLMLSVYALFELSSQFFEAARDLYSKAQSRQQDQLKNQNVLMKHFFTAQMFGPLLAWVLIKYVSVSLPLLIDACSFLLAGFWGLRLRNSNICLAERKISVLAPLRYLWQYAGVRNIFLVRTFGTKVYMGISNFLVFSVIVEHLKLEIIDSTWTYFLTGLGSTLSTLLLARLAKSSSIATCPRYIAGGAAFFMLPLIVTRVGFVNVSSIEAVVCLLAVAGTSNGAVAVLTRTIRRQACSNWQFAEVSSLESIFGFGLQGATKLLCIWAMAAGLVDYESGTYIGCLVILVTGMFLMIADFKPGLSDSRKISLPKKTEVSLKGSTG